MSKQANLLQESLERLEAGKNLQNSQEFLLVAEQPSLSLAARLRAAAWPQRDSKTVAGQRDEIIALYTQQADTTTKDRPRFNLFNDWRLPAAISAAVVIMVVCGLVAVISMGAFWLSASPQTAHSLFTKMDINKLFVSRETPEAVVEAPDLATESPELAVEPPEILSLYESLSTNEVLLTDSFGLIEVRLDEGWQIVSEDIVLTAGTDLRTGNFSSATLAFKDGSLAQIGPNTELSIETLSIDPVNSIRQVALMQLAGESRHHVIPLETSNDGYQVDTPSASGQVEGTQFQVRVDPEKSTWVVEDGAVEVSGENETVYVGAGEITHVIMDEEPTHPIDFISGQGVLSAIGQNWVIGDQSFQTHDQTIIIGNPQVGDLVFYEGHLLDNDSPVADLIVLVRRNPANTFTLTGVVEIISDTLWKVNGREIVIPSGIDIEGEILDGDLVRVKGVIIHEDDKVILQAEEVRPITDENHTPFEFTGVVQEISGDTWLISAISVTVDVDTVVDADLVPGDAVQVKGWIQKDGTWLASSIMRFLDQDSAFEFFGVIDSIGPDWMVAGISFEVASWTAIDEGLLPGDRVLVSGQIQPDGTWLAYEIQRYDDPLTTIFVGKVFSKDPWVVGGLELNVVEGETIIEGDIQVGMLVRVEMQLLSDGTHIVIRIEPFEGFDWELACQSVVVTVIRIDGDQIILDGWPAMSVSKETWIVGEIKPGSLVQTMICYDEDMNVVLVYIIVLEDPELPPPDGCDEGQDCDDKDDDVEGGKVMVCHKPDKNPHTIEISRSALPAHLNHGDTLGPCP